MIRLIKVFSLLLLSTKLFSQNITGEWIGEIYLKGKKGDYNVFFPVYFEIKHDSITNLIAGANTTKSFDSIIVDCVIDGSYDPRQDIYTILETKAVSSYPEKGINRPVLNRFKMTYQKQQEEILSGTCECLNKIVDPLCFEQLKIILRRYKGS